MRLPRWRIKTIFSLLGKYISSPSIQKLKIGGEISNLGGFTDVLIRSRVYDVFNVQ